MKTITSILDCTLRDGARIIDCKLKNQIIKNISNDLSKAKIDIVEVGFIRNNMEYQGDTTMFTNVEQIVPIISKEENAGTKFVAFVDFGMFDEDAISPRLKDSIDGIRFGFTKKNYKNSKEEIKRQMLSLKDKGYEVFFQDVNTLGYSDAELIEIIEFANTINPTAFGIVDTYGAMDMEEMQRLFSLINHNLNGRIGIDFHSHNNMQLSFALSQEMIKLCRDKRNLIIDATLNGMGKCAGNLNTELILSHMNTKLNSNYNMDLILDIIDEYLYDIKLENPWGYSIPAFMAGIYKSHPNNVIYLTEKFRLKTKDIKYIIARIDEETRQSYNYDDIQKIYVEYSANKMDDRDNIKELKEIMKNRDILLLVPGRSVQTEEENIKQFIEKKKPIVISVNFENKVIKSDFLFFGNVRRYDKYIKSKTKKIITSNIKAASEAEKVFNYFELIESTGKYFDNSTIMCLNLLQKLEISHLWIAGFDGFNEKGKAFVDDSFYEMRFKDDYKEINNEMEKMLKNVAKRITGKIEVSFLTKSIFDKLF